MNVAQREINGQTFAACSNCPHASGAGEAMSVTYRKIGGTTLAMYTEVADHYDTARTFERAVETVDGVKP